MCNIIKWIYQRDYDKIIPLLGGFHTLLVYLKVLYKKYGCLGFQDWWVDANAIAEGSVSQAIEGRHYARGIRLHKQSLCALLRFRILQNQPNDELMKYIVSLRLKITSENLERLLENDCYKTYCKELLQVGDGTQAKMTVEYIRDGPQISLQLKSLKFAF